MATKKKKKTLCCSLKRCDFESQISCQNDSHVEVKAFSVRNTKESKKLLVLWNANGDAVFHRICWDQTLKAARCRNKKRSPFPEMTEMEKSLVTEASKTAEFFDSLDKIEKEALKISRLLKQCKHCVVFSGAGISTSAGIGDYRGKDGKWTHEDRCRQNDGHRGDISSDSDSSAGPPAKRVKTEVKEEDETSVLQAENEVSYEELRPTYTHEALQKLMEIGIIKYVISQNCDGLHGLSGIPPDALSELHGNVYLEVCEKCDKRYCRPFYVMDDTASTYYEELSDCGKTDVVKPAHAKQCNLCGLCHRTGRRCDIKDCKGHLKDTIINFHDDLDEDVLSRATDQSRESDLMLCLGTTLTVTPANALVEMTSPPQRIIMCNRQKTHIDKTCTKVDALGETLGSRVFGDCDVLMRLVMREMLSDVDLNTWEQGRKERLTEYSKHRNGH